MATLADPTQSSTAAKLKDFNISPNVLSMGLGVKFPDSVESGKEYDIVIRERKCALESKSSSPNATQIDDPALARYNPSWPTDAPPFDARFPHQNQLANCERNFIDYHRCRKIKGEDYDNCYYFKKIYNARCPTFLINKWEEEVEAGTFRHRLV